MWTIGAGDHVSKQTRAEAHPRLESQGLSTQHGITEEASRQQIQVVLDSGTLSLTKIRRYTELSENVKDEHDKPCTTPCRDLPKCIKSQRQKKFRLSNTVRKDKGKKPKEQWRLKQKLEPKKLYEDKDSISWESNNNSSKLPTEREKELARNKWFTESAERQEAELRVQLQNEKRPIFSVTHSMS